MLLLDNIPFSVQKYTQLMLNRRGFRIEQIIDTDEKGISGKKPRYIAVNNHSEKLFVFFIYKTEKEREKITGKVIASIISTAKDITHIIIVHNIALTSDANKNVTNSIHRPYPLFYFETFTFHEMMFDLFEVLFENIELDDNIKKVSKFKDFSKLPILLTSDSIARYLGLREGDVLCGRFDGNLDLSYRRCV